MSLRFFLDLILTLFSKADSPCGRYTKDPQDENHPADLIIVSLPTTYYLLLTLPQTNFTISPARQNATAAMPCANTAKKGGVSFV